ncbi:MAG: hypothetical protein M3X11_18225 [Acidobacteriota bacterium]|nr:hypothetical protein [Acidobacteriota bacterium]
MAKATKAQLKKRRAVIEEIKRMIEAGTTTKFKSTEEPLKPGEARLNRYPRIVTGPNTDEHKARLGKKLEAAEAEEQRILAELELQEKSDSPKGKKR